MTDRRPADSRPADSRPVDSRPVDSRPADSRPADASHPGARPADAKGSGHPGATGPETLDIAERGAPKDGQPQRMDRRLFMQLLCFRATDPASAPALTRDLGAMLVERRVPSVIYEDVNEPSGLGLLTFAEDPGFFTSDVRPVFADGRLAGLTLRPEMTMLGRSYSSGFEDDLPFWLLERPRKTVLNPVWPWAVWYPLRRSGAFAQLDRREQGSILREHGTIGKTYGAQDLAHDVRLACHGLDARDNEFVIGLVGKDLYPLSHVVQRMRSTRQTSEFIVQMGPFFVGRAVHQHGG